MTEDKKNVLEHVHPHRREFLKKALAGAAFAAPVIATFSIDALTANSAYAFAPNTSNQCSADAGYVGPQNFQAHVSAGPLAGWVHRVNGEATFRFSLYGEGGVPSLSGINVSIQMVDNATITKAEIMVGPITAVSWSSNPYMIIDGNLTTQVACDLDELADLMASLCTTLQVTGMYAGMPYVAIGSILPVNLPPA